MNRIPSYHAWYPVLERRSAGASVILTPGVHLRAPLGGRTFFETLMTLTGIAGELVAWGTHPFVSAYFNKGDWQEAWDARLILDDATRTYSDNTVSGVGIFVEPDGEEPPSLYLPVRVFADFTRRQDAEQCRAALKEQAAKAEWNELHYEGYLIRDVGPRLKQLVVNVSTAERSELPQTIDAAGKVITICERHGGRTQAP